MSYSLEFPPPDRVLTYLRNHPALTRADRVKLFTALNDLRQFADSYRGSPERRLASESPFFWYDIIFRCDDGLLRRFWFVISDAAATYGILRVVYVEEGGPWPSAAS